MAVIRLLSPAHFDREKCEFKSLAFKNSSGTGGISVIDFECIKQGSRTVCDHVAEFYNSGKYAPIIYWKFDFEKIEKNLSLKLDDSLGDPCHHDLMNLSDKQARTKFKANKADFFCCKDGREQPIEIKDIPHFLDQHGVGSKV